MKTLFLTISMLVFTLQAHARVEDKVISVEFKYCSDDKSAVCARVYTQYNSNGSTKNYKGEEIVVQSSKEINDDIRSMIPGIRGSSLHMNIKGYIYLNGTGGYFTDSSVEAYKVLVVNSTNADDSDAPRPRGF